MDTLPRDLLAKALGGNPRVVAAFERQAQKVEESAHAASANATATDAIQDATVLVLSPNAAFTNERVLRVGSGIRAHDDGQFLTLSVADEIPHVQGGFVVHLTAQGETNIILPLAGVLVTRDATETLSGKTLEAPKLSVLGNYASDAAAATGGVPIGGVYRNASALMVRVA